MTIVSFLYHEGGDFTQPTKWFMTSVIKSSQMRLQDMPHTAVEFRTQHTDANLSIIGLEACQDMRSGCTGNQLRCIGCQMGRHNLATSCVTQEGATGGNDPSTILQKDVMTEWVSCKCCNTGKHYVNNVKLKLVTATCFL